MFEVDDAEGENDDGGRKTTKARLQMKAACVVLTLQLWTTPVLMSRSGPPKLAAKCLDFASAPKQCRKHKENEFLSDRRATVLWTLGLEHQH